MQQCNVKTETIPYQKLNTKREIKILMEFKNK